MSISFVFLEELFNLESGRGTVQGVHVHVSITDKNTCSCWACACELRRAAGRRDNCWWVWARCLALVCHMVSVILQHNDRTGRGWSECESICWVHQASCRHLKTFWISVLSVQSKALHLQAATLAEKQISLLESLESYWRREAEQKLAHLRQAGSVKLHHRQPWNNCRYTVCIVTPVIGS